MLKKLLILTPLVILGAGGFWLWQRVSANPEGVIPVPYKFAESTEKIAVEVPLLIVGDRMAARFGLFKETLSLDISVGLSKPLKTGVLAAENSGLHRTLHQLENLSTWPKVMIYTGGSEEMVEEKFLTHQIHTIRTNFDRYQDDFYRSLMMVWPWSAKVVYEPLARKVLSKEPPKLDPENKINEQEYQVRLELAYRLYEIELNRMIELARDNGTILILMTTPVNLDIPPKKSCETSRTPESIQGMSAVRDLIRAQDYKGAYPKSQALMQESMANAEVHFLHGQVCARLGIRAEALDALIKAAAFDCLGWRANQVTNNIMRKVADEQRVTLFDFAAMVENDWGNNTTFFNEIYPQDLYYEKASKALALVLRRMLKL